MILTFIKCDAKTESNRACFSRHCKIRHRKRNYWQSILSNESQKLIDQQVNEYLGKLPSIKDKEIKERLENLKKRSVSNDNNDYDDSSIFGKSP